MRGDRCPIRPPPPPLRRSSAARFAATAEAIVRIRTPAKVTSIPLLAANPDSDLGRSDQAEVISGGVRSRTTYARRSARWHARDSQSIDIGCGGEDMDG